MEIQNTWEEVVDFAEDLLIFIFNGLRTGSKYWMDVIQREYPDAGNFKIPSGRAPRLRFSEGIKMLREAGIEASEDEDIKHVPPPNPPAQTPANAPPPAPRTKRPSAAWSSKSTTPTFTS